MKYYFSGGGTSGVWEPINLGMVNKGYCRLLSFAYQNNLWWYLKLVADAKVPTDLILDSGAFTAWSKGEEVDRNALALAFEKVLEVGCIRAHLINLDRIPGRKGVDPTPQELVDAMKESEQNYEWLDKRFPGKVLPVYHQGEPISYLRQLAASGAYICLSPRNDLPERLRVAWAQEMHSVCPGVPTHGLATTGAPMMSTVPWFSVDSATWIMTAAYGSIWIPKARGFSVLSVSMKNSSVKEEGNHYTTLSATEQRAVEALVSGEGFDLGRLIESDQERYIWNAHVAHTRSQALDPIHVHQPGLFE
jgi:hypothetical protein